MTEEATVALKGDAGSPTAELTIRCLPGRSQWQTQDYLRIADHESAAARVQLLEEAEYEYSLTGLAGELLVLEPTELFDPSGADGRNGRLRPKRWTGTIEVVIVTGGMVRARGEFEVRSRKLNYETEYKWMLNGITAYSAELAQLAFAPALLSSLRPTSGTAATAYQRFAFIQSFVQGEAFSQATQAVLRRPHHEYRELRYDVDVGRGVRLDRSAARDLVKPGRRTRLPSGYLVAGHDSLPERLSKTEHVETFDTVPNRLVKHAMAEWRMTAESVISAFDNSDGPLARRARREAAIVAERLDDVLRSKVLQNVGRLTALPAGNTALQGRSGYRELFRAYLQSDAASKIDWPGGVDLFRAGQVDVAALYEYWVFLELARIIGTVPGIEISHRRLLSLSRDRLALRLHRGSASVVTASGVFRGHRVRLDLWFNKSFPSGASPTAVGSWSVNMRPDCSLRIRRLDTTDPVERWVHFDAKYRLDSYSAVLGDGASNGEAPLHAGPLNDDLLKMHAYRDAIRRSSGAFVLYPGSDENPKVLNEFHELLPGLGAFVLRPDADGTAENAGAIALRDFVLDVIEHIAAAGTDEERSRFWVQRTYAERRGRRLSSQAPTPLPAADTKVLLGFVRSPEHRAWIEATSMYNLRADDRTGGVGLRSPELGADLLLLYAMFDDVVTVKTTTGAFRLMTRHEMNASGYPSPRGDLYCCLETQALNRSVRTQSAEFMRQLARQRNPSTPGTPVVVTWLDVAAHELLPNRLTPPCSAG